MMRRTKQKRFHSSFFLQGMMTKVFSSFCITEGEIRMFEKDNISYVICILENMSFQVSALDDEELIHTAARQGHRISLEIYLSQNPQCANKLFTYRESLWTPLLAACFYKHEDVVRMLLRCFRPDIHTTGTINLRTLENRFELVEEVPPLWTAAAVNHFDIVKLLVEQGHANVNQLIKTHSTALRAACYHNNLEMVHYLITHGANPHQARKGNYSNLMLCAGRQYPLIVKYLLDEAKCDINEQDENGQTALYYAVRSGSVEMTQILLEHGAQNLRDYKRKITPLIRGALFGDANVVHIFQDYCSDLEWIEATELLATSFSGCISRIENPKKTIEYITEAFELRSRKNLPKSSTIESFELLPTRSECQTLEEFNELINSNEKDTIHIEMIFLHRRILGEDQNDYHDAIHNHGARLATNHQYHECFRWWFYELNLKRKFHIPCQSKYFELFLNLFIQMKYVDQMNIDIEDLIEMFDMMNYVLTSEIYRKYFQSNFILLLHLISLVARLLHSENTQEKQDISLDNCRKLYKSLRSIIRQHFQTELNHSSLLHLCTDSSTTQSHSSYIT